MCPADAGARGRHPREMTRYFRGRMLVSLDTLYDDIRVLTSFVEAHMLFVEAPA